MGGFVFDFEESFLTEPRPFAAGIDRLCLTPRGIKLLAQCGQLPVVSERDIADKSKIDEIGKLLACIQASWMVVQVCTRLGVGLPVTLLEVGAISHVLCALIVYALWWHKPRKIGEPTVLKGEWAGPLAAFMMMSSQVGQDQMLPGFRVAGEQSEIAGLKFYTDFCEDEYRSQREAGEDISQDQQPTSHEFRIRSRSWLPQLEQIDSNHELLREDEDPQSKLMRRRWKLACEAIERYPAVRRMLRRPLNGANRKMENALAAYPEMPKKMKRSMPEEKMTEAAKDWWECGSQHLVTAVASNWPHDGLMRTTGGLVVGATLWFASIAFSAIYIAAWDADFPSSIEAWLWRSSAVYVAFSGLLWACLHIVAELSARLWWMWYNIMSGDASEVVMASITVVCTICGCMYLFARAFLMIEAFMCLRSLTVASYVVPSWTQGIPHVG